MNNNEEIKIIDQNIFLSLLFIISVIASILISLNEKLEKEGKETIFTSETSTNINLSNRVFSLCLVIGFLIINYHEYNIKAKKGSNLKPLKHQLWASYLTLAASLIALYVVFENRSDNFQIFNIENPTI